MRQILLPILVCWAAGCDEVVVLAGGEPQPDIKKPKSFNLGKLRFSYPGNWVQSKEDQETKGVKIRTVWVKSKGNAMAVVQTFMPSVPIDLNDYAREFLGGMNEEFKNSWSGMIRAGTIKKSSYSEQFLGKKREGRRIELMLKALGFPHPMEVTLLGAQLADGSVVMCTMVPVKYKNRVRPGYEHIRSSVRFGARPASK
jgi:hypothetical protein